MIMARWPDAFSTDFVGAPTKIARFLMPARYVRPYSKGQKNDFRDAEAIAEAVQRPTMKLSRPRQSTNWTFRARIALLARRALRPSISTALTTLCAKKGHRALNTAPTEAAHYSCEHRQSRARIEKDN
jgi:transposase